MSLVGYRVIDPAGGVFASEVPGNGHISLNGQNQVSLELRSSEIEAYMRSGDALVVRLMSGETITLDHYFDDGYNKELYISTDSHIERVNVLAADGDGAADVTYAYIDASGKVTPYDNLLFYTEELAFQPEGLGIGSLNIDPKVAGLAALGVLGVGGAALALSGGDGGGGGHSGGDSGATETVKPLDLTIAATGGADGVVDGTQATADGGIMVNGSTVPGASVDVKFLGATQTVIADANGDYSTVFDRSLLTADLLDADGGSPTVTATAFKDGRSGSTSSTIPLDLATEVTLNQPVTADNIINNAEANSGFTLTGTTEPGQTEVNVMFGATSLAATVDEATGTWSVVVPSTAIPGHGQNVDIQVTAIDHLSNMAQTQTITVPVDRLVENLTEHCPPPEDTNGDKVLSNAEAADGVTLQGTTEVGSQSVSVQLISSNGTSTTYAAAIAADGSWTVDVPKSDLEDGANYSVKVTAIDHVGNEGVITDQNCFSTDFSAPDSVIATSVTVDSHGNVEGLRILSTADDLSFTEVTEGGGFVEHDLVTRASFSAGQTDVGFAGTMVPDGSDGILTVTDDAGNLSSTYIAFDDTASNDIDLAGLSDFNVDMVDLSFDSSAELVLTPDLVKGLSENGDTLTIAGNSNAQGNADDTVVANGAVDTGQDVMINGETFSVYSFEDTTLNIDDEINVVTSTP